MSQGRNEWVEIIEPTSREKMFANPATGEIAFSPPEGVEAKPMSSNQWWELFDQTSNMNYYYNAVTGETIWNKPDEGADIISLTKLQSVSSDSDQPSSPASTTLEPVLEETDGPQKDEVFNEHNDQVKHNTLSESNPHNEPTRKLSDMLKHEIEPMSPLKIDFPDSSFGVSTDMNTTEEPSMHVQATNIDTATPEGSVELRRKELQASGVHYQEHDRGSWVNIKMVKEQLRRNSSGSEGGGVDGRSQSQESRVKRASPGELRLDDKRVMGGSLDRTNRGRDQLAAGLNSSYSRTLDNRGSKRAPARPAPALPNKSPDTKLKSPSNLNAGSHPNTSSSSAVHVTTTTTTSTTGTLTPDINNDNESLARAKSNAPPVAPPFKPPVRRATATASGSELESFQDLAQHRKGLFRKKVTIANMLNWTKEPIKQPMIQTRDKQLKKEAVDLFKLLLQFMGDRRTKYKDVNLLALEISTRAWEKKGLRDEIYIQLCRQTSGNSNPKSLEKGWEMIAICLAFFPPSIKFRSYLEGYLWRHVDPKPEYKGVPVEVYAQYCHKKVEKMAQSGAKKGLKKPNIEEVVHAKRAPFNPSMFGTSLEDVMEMQKDKFPECKMPWVVQALVSAVLKLQGPSTEGIFRVPGDIDEVNGLKLQMDKGVLPMETLRDPHVPASLLKLWFRELEDPLIPEEYYQECIDNCGDEVNALSLVQSLPDLNRELLIYLVKFLKQFVTPENIECTKMGLENIAMVWAPNFLRCPSDDHTLIFQNTRKEMAFLRILLQFLDTENGDD